MTRHADGSAVQRQAIGAVVSICVSADARRELTEQGCVGLIRTALRVHIDSTGVVEQAPATPSLPPTSMCGVLALRCVVL